MSQLLSNIGTNKANPSKNLQMIFRQATETTEKFLVKSKRNRKTSIEGKNIRIPFSIKTVVTQWQLMSKLQNFQEAKRELAKDNSRTLEKKLSKTSFVLTFMNYSFTSRYTSENKQFSSVIMNKLSSSSITIHRAKSTIRKMLNK